MCRCDINLEYRADKLKGCKCFTVGSLLIDTPVWFNVRFLIFYRSKTWPKVPQTDIFSDKHSLLLFAFSSWPPYDITLDQIINSPRFFTVIHTLLIFSSMFLLDCNISSTLYHHASNWPQKLWLLLCVFIVALKSYLTLPFFLTAQADPPSHETPSK